MKNLLKIINAKDKGVTQIDIENSATNANPLVIKGQRDSTYEFFAPSIDRAPNELVMKREGNCNPPISHII